MKEILFLLAIKTNLLQGWFKKGIKKRDPIGSLIAWQRPTLAERKSDYHRR